MSYFSGTASRLRPYHFTYPERELTMKEILHKFINEGQHEHEEMRAFINDFKTTNEILLKEHDNSLIELRFEVQKLLRIIESPPVSNCEIKGVTTRGGKTTTQYGQKDDTNMNGEKPRDKPVESNEVVMENQPQGTNAPIVQQSIREQTPLIPFPKRLRKENEEAQQRNFLEKLKQLHVNILFIEALIQMPKYAKYLKSLLKNKSRLEAACMVTMNERCSAILLNELTSKEKYSTSIRRIDLVNMPYSEMKPEVEKISEEEKSSLLQVLEKLKEAEYLATYPLSRFENPHIEVLTEREITDKFFDDHLMVLKSKFKDDEPCQDLLTGGHHNANVTVKKVYESGFYWPSVFKDANEYVRRCDACQRSGNIYSRNEMPSNNIQ
ncbi:reverse transcriptase domain-containing protein, partial [Tanacetum coccineum]